MFEVSESKRNMLSSALGLQQWQILTWQERLEMLGTVSDEQSYTTARIDKSRAFRPRLTRTGRSSKRMRTDDLGHDNNPEKDSDSDRKKKLWKKVRSIKTNFRFEKRICNRNGSFIHIAAIKDSGASCVIKTFKNKKSREARNEVAICSQVTSLHHPYLLGALGIYETPKELHLVMEYCKGGMLFDQIASRKHYCEDDAARVIRMIALGLQALHCAGIAHRDLKPENIMLVDGSALKIMDFGHAHRRGTVDGFEGRLLGTEGHTPPELLTGHRVGTPSDVWTLGTTMYYMLCGRPPFGHPRFSSKNRIRLNVIQGKFHMDDHPKDDLRAIWRAHPPKAKDLIRQMLTDDPKKRPTIEAVLAHEWLSSRFKHSQTHLTSTISSIRSLAAWRRFRAAVHTVMTVQRLGKGLTRSGSGSSPSKSSLAAAKSCPR